jgi:Domain of unknown function (DUF4878)
MRSTAGNCIGELEAGRLYRARVSPTLRRRIAAALLIVGIAVAALAIADVGPFEDPATVEERVAGAVREVFAAAAAGEAKAFCDRLTPAYREALEIQVAQAAQSDEPAKCERVMEVFLLPYQDSEIEVHEVSVSGNRARVEARLRLPDHGAQPRTVLLVEGGGSWRVSELNAG